MRSLLAAVLAFLFLSTPALCCGVSRIPPLPVLEGRMAEMRERIAADPADNDAWSAWIRNLEMTGLYRPGEDDELRAEVQEVIEAWIAGVPGDPAPYLARSEHLPDLEAREEALRDLVGNLRDAVEGFETLARFLVESERPEEATALLDGFLDGHPNDPAAYRVLVAHQERLDDAEAALAVAQRWRARFPDDLDALTWHLKAGLLSSEDLLATTKRLAESVEPATLLRACELLGHGLPAAAAECAWRVAGQDKDPEAAYQAQDALYRILPEAGDWGGVLRLLAQDADRERAASNRPSLALQAAENGACEVTLEMVGGPLDKSSRRIPGRLEVATALSRCGEEDRARAIAAEYATEAPSVFLYDDRRLEELLGVDALTAILFRRLETAPDDATLFGILSDLLEGSERVEQRISLLMTWSDVQPDNVTPPLQAAHLFEQLGQPETARGFYEEILRRDPSRLDVFGDLFRTFRKSGDVDRARKLAESLRQSDEVERRWLGRGLIAQAAYDEGRFEEAIAELAGLQKDDREGVPYWIVHVYRAALRDAGRVKDLEAFDGGPMEEVTLDRSR